PEGARRLAPDLSIQEGVPNLASIPNPGSRPKDLAATPAGLIPRAEAGPGLGEKILLPREDAASSR
ncbi:MAG TPA: hypothetical protein VHG08_24225, partial [Longimicrobium sp.]|nr:hypothetical protein [Longimicrobium sp.]